LLVADAVAKLRALVAPAFGFAIVALRNSSVYVAALLTSVGRNASAAVLLAIEAFAGSCSTVAC
jgi:hypothetical protein